MPTNTNPPAPDWYDEIAVERALKNKPVGRRLTKAERHGVVRELRRRGANKNAVCRVLRCNGVTATKLLEQTAA